MTRILLASVCLLTALELGACRREDPTTKAIRATVFSGAAPVMGSWSQLARDVYKDRDYRPLWLDGRKLQARGRELIATLCHAERDGLRAADYDLTGIRSGLKRLRAKQQPDSSVLAALDLRLTRSFLDYGGDLLAGKLDPQAVDNGWYIRARRARVDSILRASLEKSDFDDIIEPLRPHRPEYQELVTALANYRELQAQGGWATVPAGGTRERGHGRTKERKHGRTRGRGNEGTIKWGDEGARVGALRYRLEATGELDKAAGRPVYDDKVAQAVARFQERHGIAVDSTVGPATLAALNVPVETRIRQIELNLERYRWLPSDFGKRYILVNIPDYRLYAYDGGKERLTMRVIVGDEYGNATPVFADSMTYLVFRPQWDVPRRILVDEVIPRVRKNLYYLAQHSFELVDTVSNQVIADPASIKWSRLDTAKIHFRLRQKSGPGNALGNVKFMFPNQYSIYLHDTPAYQLFERTKRTLSHGCVRVEDPVRLADFVLDGQNHWDEKKILETMQPVDSAQAVVPVTLDLERPIPVYLLYLTAFVRDGVLHFREDPYGKDARAISRLGPPAPLDRTECEQLQELAGN